MKPGPPPLKLLRQQGLVQDTADGQPRILPYACLVPFATGTLKGASKAWPGFPTLCRQLVPELPVLLMPGPGPETIQARTDYPDAQTLAGVPLDVYAALLAQSSVVVANDTGPGHLAAAVGARLVSVLGPTDASRYRALGPHVTLTPAPSLARGRHRPATGAPGHGCRPPGLTLQPRAGPFSALHEAVTSRRIPQNNAAGRCPLSHTL